VVRGLPAHDRAIAWIGYDQPRSLGDKETGGGLALPIWIDYMRQGAQGRSGRSGRELERCGVRRGSGGGGGPATGR
jgi:membrane carboxypeptidase/penicillin-binding protein